MDILGYRYFFSVFLKKCIKVAYSKPYGYSPTEQICFGKFNHRFSNSERCPISLLIYYGVGRRF